MVSIPSADHAGAEMQTLLTLSLVGLQSRVSSDSLHCSHCSTAKRAMDRRLMRFVTANRELHRLRVLEDKKTLHVSASSKDTFIIVIIVRLKASTGRLKGTTQSNLCANDATGHVSHLKGFICTKLVILRPSVDSIMSATSSEPPTTPEETLEFIVSSPSLIFRIPADVKRIKSNFC